MWIAIVISCVVLVAAIWAFNRLTALKVRASNAWADIDVQLKRRADLVPPLVETVRGYAAHERRTFEETIAARSNVQQASTIDERSRAESSVGRHLATIIALQEAYPNLKADAMFRSLHSNLVQVEDHLQSARRYYNAVVRDYNTMLRQFPYMLIAGIASLKPREFFELDDARQAAATVVSLPEKQS